ncbi:hypothetical protein GCM10022251_74750 [Phytohabitans flavus]|uniref:Methyltransferase type 11 domain-containing protein n=1 Tax=Phytohabitans flavus TaxID=1076124 RepID=A0A6F8XLI4_9ACTN|nr:class I SAM-dependent methyltransferase [Phytohabitans flavus]BCB74667.1 hypothetical protein Pflav_010770 [Phytohabitans flavus]
MDARDLDEVNAFDAAFWAQPFFREPARVATLHVIRRALKPGGLLVVQELEREPEAADLPAFTLRRLVYQGLGVPFALSAEQLAVEAESAGFELARQAATSFGRFAVLRRPAE